MSHRNKPTGAPDLATPFLTRLAVAGVLFLSIAGPVPAQTVSPRLSGHPPLAPIALEEPPPPIAVDEPPLVDGPYVNFEAASVKALALSPDGDRLFVASTAGESILVLDVSDDELLLAEEIVVGMNPVSVAVQPLSEPLLVWSANALSDSVSVVDTDRGEVIAVVPVHDEPANILFDDTGSTAFVVCQNSTVIAVDAATHGVLDTLELDGHTTRAAAYRDGDLYLAALHSGNNTTVVSRPVELVFEGNEGTTVPMLVLAQNFERTAELFEDPQLSPYPDPPTQVSAPSPLVFRIVPDAGVTENNPWTDLLATVDDGTGQPRAEAVGELEQQILANRGVVLDNAEAVLQQLLDDYADTDDHDLFVVDVSDPSALSLEHTIGDVGTTLTGLAVDPVSGKLFVSNLEPRNLVRHEPALRGHFVDHEIVIVHELEPPLVERTNLHSDVPGFDDVSEVNETAQAASLANPVDLVFDPTGARAYVASLAADRVGVLDAATGAVLGRVDVGRGPRSLALDAARARLYVLNRTDLSVSIVDVSTDAPVSLSTFELPNPEPPAVRDGRNFLYSARFSNNFGSSCAMCHIDGNTDHLAWDLGDPDGVALPAPPPIEDRNVHPVKGPMVTQPLFGLVDHQPYHWRGDRPTFADFNPAFDTLMGGRVLSDSEMSAFTQFVESIVYPPNPFRNRDNSFVDSRAPLGSAVFRMQCDECHDLSHDGARQIPGEEGRGDIATPRQGDGTGVGDFKQVGLIRQMRGLYKKLDSDRFLGFGLLQDGRLARDEGETVLTTFHGLFERLEGRDAEIQGLNAFVTAFPTNVAPIVGWQLRLTSPVSPEQRDDLDLMLAEHQREPSRCDVVFHGKRGGVLSAGLYLGEIDRIPTFQREDGTLLSLDDVLAQVDAGVIDLVFLTVPPGSGTRVAFE